MTLLRAVLVAVLFSIPVLISAGPASADQEGIKIEIGGPTTYIYLGGDPDARQGTGGVCVDGQGASGTLSFPPQAPTATCPDVPAGTEIVTLPPGGGGGGEEPPLPCSDQATCQALIEGLLGGGGGGEEPPLPCSDQATCQALIEALLGGGGGGEPGAPSQRDCTGASGGAATCVDFGEGNFILGDSPEDGQGELGVCAGGSYFYVAGPGSPDGGAGEACPAAAPAPTAGGGGGETPPPDRDGDGLADSNDSCPDSAAGTSNGCPPETQSAPAPTGGETISEPQTTQRTADPAPAAPPSLDITRNRLRVSKRGWVRIPLACRSTREACVGELRLTATRRTATGRRVRVLLARAGVRVAAGDTARRRVRLTKAGRRLLARRNPLRTTARIVIDHDSGTTVRRERLLLRRA